MGNIIKRLEMFLVISKKRPILVGEMEKKVGASEVKNGCQLRNI